MQQFQVVLVYQTNIEIVQTVLLLLPSFCFSASLPFLLGWKTRELVMVPTSLAPTTVFGRGRSWGCGLAEEDCAARTVADFTNLSLSTALDNLPLCVCTLGPSSLFGMIGGTDISSFLPTATGGEEELTAIDTFLSGGMATV